MPRAAIAVMVALLPACDDGPAGVGLQPACDLETDLLISSLAPDAIPALTEPPMVSPGEPGTEYLLEDDRVLGVVVNGEARAYPHNILWWHEIINDRIGDRWISVTFCPLTGSGLAFDPNVPGGSRLDLGVSGLLFANNLVMWDRESRAVYGPQLAVEGKCDMFRDRSLDLVPVQEMSWARWKELHPDTKVVSGDLSYGRNYRVYPYFERGERYDELDADWLIQTMSVDRTRPIKERVLAIREGTAGKGYPFLELQELGPVVALNEMVEGVPTAIFFEERDGMAAMAFDARVDGQTLTFRADVGNDVWTDDETGSTWTLDGEAIEGAMRGNRLVPRASAYVLLWFAWRHFQPDGVTFDADAE